MALWDHADCLARCIALADRPTSDQSISSTRFYQLLSEAQEYWFSQFAVHAPQTLITAPTLLTTADGGLTYTFSGSVTPLFALIYTSTGTNAQFMRPGSWDDPNADYVWEGSKIRMTRGQTRSFSNGPASRHVAPPGQIDASTAPTLTPTHARALLVYHAVAEWARQGGKRNPDPFEKKEQELAWGRPQTGDIGILGALKMANPFLGMMAYGQPGLVGTAWINQVYGYTAI